MKLSKILFFTLCALLLLWVFGSFVEIASHNSAPWQEGYAQYSPINLFTLF